MGLTRYPEARTGQARKTGLLGGLVLVLGAVLMSTLAGSSGAAIGVAPSNTGEPSVTGTPRVGELLRTTRGTWTGTTPITYTYQWRRCNGAGLPDASNCTQIGNANNATYQVRSADVGFRIRSRVTATNADGSASAASNPTDTVSSAKPTNTDKPSISGTPVVGNQLTANRGTWVGNTPITYAFQWLRCSSSGNNCGEISGATDNQYVVVDNDVGRTLRVRVTARNDAGTKSAISNPTDQVRANTPPPAGNSVSAESLKATGDRLVVSQVRFAPNPVTSRSRPITVTIKVIDTKGRNVRGAFVFIRSVPRRTTGGDRQATGADGLVTYQLQPLQHFPAVNGNVQFFVKAYRAGDPPLAGVAGYRLVQVGVRTAGQ
jgi:predicted actin-binding protein